MGDVKDYIARKNLSFKLNGFKVLIEEVFDHILNDKLNNCCSHVKTIEERYWSSDIAVKNEIEKNVIYVDSSDSGADTEDKLVTPRGHREDEQYNADNYDCDTEVGVSTDEDMLTVDNKHTECK